MKALVLGAVLTTLATLGACGGGSSEEPPPAPPEKTVFDPLTSQKDRVKQVADELPQQRKDDLDAAIEQDSN